MARGEREREELEREKERGETRLRYLIWCGVGKAHLDKERGPCRTKIEREDSRYLWEISVSIGDRS